MKTKVVVFLIAALFLNIGAAHGQKSGLMSHRGDPILIDPIYHTYEEVVDELDSIAKANPDITRLDTIGISTTDSSVILALKISDNPILKKTSQQFFIMEYIMLRSYLEQRFVCT